MSKFILTSKILLSAIALVFVLSACDKNIGVTEPDETPGKVAISQSDNQIIGMNEFEIAIDKSSAEMPLAANANASTYKITPLPMGPFQKAIKKMNVTAEQKIALDLALEAYRACEVSALEALKTAQNAINAEAQAMRKAINDSLKAKLITKAQAKTALAEVDAWVANEMATNDAILSAKEQLRNCLLTLDAAVKEILNDDQEIIWNNFFAAYLA